MRRALAWEQCAPTFSLIDTSLDALSQRPRNAKKGIELAEQKMAEMSSWPSDACSGRWYDEDGKLLIAAFSDHILEVGFPS